MKAPMLKSGRSDATRGCLYHGCSCCNSKQVRRAAKKSAKRREARELARVERSAY